MKFKTISFYWILAALLPIFAVYQAIAFPIEEYAYDTAEFHIYRGVVYSAARADGWLYPRWVQSLNGGLGGPFFSLYPPLVYSLMDVFHSLGVPHPIGWRLLVALALVAGSVGMFGLGITLLKRADLALACATFFVYAGFILRDLFERGAPSGMALALFPAMLWLLLRFVERPSGFRLLLASLCLAVIILIHSQTAFLLIPLAGLVIVYLFVRGGIKRAAFALVPLVGGILLAAFYMLPFPIEVKFVQFDNALQVDYTNVVTNPLRLEDILAAPTNLDIGIGNNRMGEAPGGLVHALALPVGLALTWMLLRRKRNADAVLVAGFTLLGFVVMWMQLDAATPVWSALPSLGVFLFRWKLLGILAIITPIIVGYALEQFPDRIQRVALVVLVVGYLVMQLGLIYPLLFFHYTQFAPSPSVADAQRSALEHGALGLSSFDEFLPNSRTAPFSAEEVQRVAASPIETLPAGGRILQQSQRTGSLELTIDSPVPFVAPLHILYFPGWAGYVDGQPQVLRPENFSGYVLMDVPAGIHTLVLRYEGTTIQHIGEATTLATGLILLIFAVVWRRKGDALADQAAIFPSPRWSILLLLLFALAIKALWIDPQTTLFRSASTCAAIEGVQVQTDVWFGDTVRLCGLATERTQVHPGDVLSVTLYWQLDQPADKPADSFVHLLGTTFNPETGNPLWGQLDKASDVNRLTQWVPGKLYRDQSDFRIPPHTPPGEYQLEIGWSQSSNGQRLKPRIVGSAESLSVSSLDSLLWSRITVR